MKKLFYLILATMAVSFAFVSCSDDDDNQNGLLEGTFWVYRETSPGLLWLEAIEFQEGGKCVYVYLEQSGSTVTDQGEAVGTYTYNPPIVVCRVSMNRESTTMKLQVNGNKMTDERGQEFILQMTE